MVQTTRIPYLDIAKGTLILSLVLHHIPEAANIFLENTDSMKIITSWQSIYTSFFIQAFFFVSGYCTDFDVHFLAFIKKISLRLLLPILIFSIIAALAYSLIFLDPEYLRPLISLKFYINGAHLWFLFALFFAKSIVWAMKWFVKYESVNFVFAVALVVCGFWLYKNHYAYNLFCIYHAMVAVLFVYLGNWMAEHKDIYEFSLQYLGYLFPLILILTKSLGANIPTVTWGMNLRLSYIPLFVVTAVTGTMLMLKICKDIGKCKWLEAVGRQSLNIYGLHYIVLVAIFYYVTK